jgi:hypothetical protein
VIKTAAVALVLLAAAAPGPAFARTTFALSGTVSSASCWEFPSTHAKLIQCELAIAPDPGTEPEREWIVYCLDPVAGAACGSFEIGAPVVAFGEVQNGFKVVQKIGIRTKEEF